MPCARAALTFSACLILPFSASAQQAAQPQPAQPLQRDAQAVVVLQQSVAALGNALPSDVTATGTVFLVAGSKTETGTIRILIRGFDQTSETVQTTDSNRRVIYSHGVADEVDGTTAKPLSMEQAATSQSSEFPLALLARALNDPDSAFQYIGPESLDCAPVQHVRFWSTFASSPKLRQLAEFSVKDLWVDAVSGLPRKLSYARRTAGGSAPRIPVEVSYSNYRGFSGLVYPSSVKVALNGTPWETITIQTVSLNTGLTDADFPVN